MPSDGLLRADNLTYEATGHLRGRQGRVLYGTVANKAVALWRHYPRSGSPAFLAINDNGTTAELRHDTASNGTFAAVTGGTGYATGRKWYFTNWASKDRSFYANGVALYSYNGTATTVTQSGGQILGPYLVVHKSRLFGTRGDEINYSVYSSNVNDETTIDAANQINVSDPQGGAITGLTSLPDRLLILKSTSLWTMLGDIKYSSILTKFSEVGCVAPQSVQNTVYGTIFVGRAGVYLTDGQNPVPMEISRPIRPLFVTPLATSNVYPNAVATWYPRKEMYVVKLDPAHAYTYRVQRVVPVGQNGAKWAWSLNSSEPMIAGTCWDADSDSGNMYVSDASGNIFWADTSNTDAGLPFGLRAQTAFMRLSDDQRVGRVHYVFLNYCGSNSATVGIRYNNASTDALALSLGQVPTGQAVQRCRQKVNDQVQSGQFVSSVVTLPFGDAATSELYGLRLDVRLRSDRIWR